MIQSVPQAVLNRYPGFAGASARPLETGLINDTFLVEAGGLRVIFQRLHPIFHKEVNLDVAAVTRMLIQRGLRSPQLLETDAGALWVEHDDRVWRALSYVPGTTHNKIENAEMAREAGALVARFHEALHHLEHKYHSRRANVHDTARHLELLRQAIEAHPTHSLHGEVVELSGPLLHGAMPLQDHPSLPLRHCHGDLKISNIIFDESGKAVCLIDLDTVCMMQWHLELGDALRSWCNPGTEDDLSSRFELTLLDAALAGYASERPVFLTETERGVLIAGLAQICQELAVRFLTDALNERYFGWDESRYPSRGAHNLRRAHAMLQLHRSVIAQRDEAESIVAARLKPR